MCLYWEPGFPAIRNLTHPHSQLIAIVRQWSHDHISSQIKFKICINNLNCSIFIQWYWVMTVWMHECIVSGSLYCIDMGTSRFQNSDVPISMPSYLNCLCIFTIGLVCFQKFVQIIIEGEKVVFMSCTNIWKQETN